MRKPKPYADHMARVSDELQAWTYAVMSGRADVSNLVLAIKQYQTVRRLHCADATAAVSCGSRADYRIRRRAHNPEIEGSTPSPAI